MLCPCRIAILSADVHRAWWACCCIHPPLILKALQLDSSPGPWVCFASRAPLLQPAGLPLSWLTFPAQPNLSCLLQLQVCSVCCDWCCVNGFEACQATCLFWFYNSCPRLSKTWNRQLRTEHHFVFSVPVDTNHGRDGQQPQQQEQRGKPDMRRKQKLRLYQAKQQQQQQQQQQETSQLTENKPLIQVCVRGSGMTSGRARACTLFVSYAVVSCCMIMQEF